MKIAIILNSTRVTRALIEKLNDPALAEKYNLTCDVFIKKPYELETFLKRMNPKTYNAYIIGGGDGTVRTAAQVFIEQDMPMAILPLGSFNFLARTLNYPDDIDAILSMVKNNKTKQIDLGNVNGQVFINHSWIGFYYYLLKLRNKYRHILGTNRILKSIFNIVNMFSTLPFYDLEFIIDGKTNKIRTCLVYISNNEQYTNFLNFSERKSLSLGVLSIYIFNCESRWELFKCMLTIFNNTFEESPFVTKYSADNLVINSKYPIIRMVIDGELCKMETPLNYSIYKKQLTVFLP